MKSKKCSQDKLCPEILKFPAYANHILWNAEKMQKKKSAITNWKETYQCRSGSVKFFPDIILKFRRYTNLIICKTYTSKLIQIVWLPISNNLLLHFFQRKYVEMADRAREELTVLQGQESLLPKATIPVTKVAGIDMAVENVGPALQFLEHCKNFSQVPIPFINIDKYFTWNKLEHPINWLAFWVTYVYNYYTQIVYNLNDGEAERILDEIIQGWDGSSGQPSVLEKFQRDMLTIILADKKTWYAIL